MNHTGKIWVDWSKNRVLVCVCRGRKAACNTLTDGVLACSNFTLKQQFAKRLLDVAGLRHQHAGHIQLPCTVYQSWMYLLYTDRVKKPVYLYVVGVMLTGRSAPTYQLTQCPQWDGGENGNSKSKKKTPNLWVEITQFKWSKPAYTSKAK